MNYTTKISIDASTTQDLLNAMFNKAAEAIEKLKRENISCAYIMTRAEIDRFAATADSARDNLYTLIKLLEAMSEEERKFKAEQKGGEA